MAQTKFSSVVLFLGAFFFASNLLAQDKVRIAYVGPSLSNLPLLAANETGILARHKLSSWPLPGSAPACRPTRVWRILFAVQSQGRFADKKAAFEDVTDARFAIQAARELGHKAE